MVEIRRATAADAEGILACCRCLGAESDNLTFGAEGVPFTVEQERAYLEGISRSERQLYLVAVQDGRIIGTASLSCFERPRLAHRGEISIAICKEAWGQGIGTAMMQQIIRFARECAHVEILSLEVRSDNARAIALYEKFGFETIGVFDGFMQIGGAQIPCNIMRLHL